MSVAEADAYAAAGAGGVLAIADPDRQHRARANVLCKYEIREDELELLLAPASGVPIPNRSEFAVTAISSDEFPTCRTASGGPSYR